MAVFIWRKSEFAGVSISINLAFIKEKALEEAEEFGYN